VSPDDARAEGGARAKGVFSLRDLRGAPQRAPANGVRRDTPWLSPRAKHGTLRR
jgi:hypothetical protein